METAVETKLSAIIKAGGVVGTFDVHEVPLVSHETGPERVFLIMNESPCATNWRVNAFIKILSLAGWGNSTVIATNNYPSLGNALTAGGVDYLIFGRSKAACRDLYLGFLKGEPYGERWKNKVLVFDISLTENDAPYFVEKFKALLDVAKAADLKG